MERPGSPPRRVALLASAALLLTALLGLVHLPFPFHGDQALFEVVARSLERGAVLYVDVWDNKQPGIFWFFQGAGKLFGFTETGTHALDLLWQVGLGALLAFGLSREFEKPALAAFLLPLATAGAYWCAVREDQLTQIEALIGLPLAASMILARPGAGRFSLFLSGACAGVVAVFKHILAPIAVLFWGVAIWQAWRGHGHEAEPPSASSPSSSRSLRALPGAAWPLLLPAAAGVLLVLGLVAAHFAANGALGPLAWNAFVYPPRAVVGSPAAPMIRYVDSPAWFVTRFAPWIVLAALGAWRGKRDWVRSYALAWLAGAALVLLAQRFSIWTYHFQLFIVPVGILAVRGIEAPKVRPAARAAIAAAALLPGLILWAPKAEAWAAIAPGTDPAAVWEYQKNILPRYGEIWDETEFLRDPAAAPGPIYVWGDPRRLLMSGRRQAIPLDGWAWEDMLDEQLAESTGQLKAAPPPYLYLNEFTRATLRRRSPATLDWVDATYAFQARGTNGEWRRRSDLPPVPVR